jgi:hypothetical protein
MEYNATPSVIISTILDNCEDGDIREALTQSLPILVEIEQVKSDYIQTIVNDGRKLPTLLKTYDYLITGTCDLIVRQLDTIGHKGKKTGRRFPFIVNDETIHVYVNCYKRVQELGGPRKEECLDVIREMQDAILPEYQNIQKEDLPVNCPRKEFYMSTGHSKCDLYTNQWLQYFLNEQLFFQLFEHLADARGHILACLDRITTITGGGDADDDEEVDEEVDEDDDDVHPSEHPDTECTDVKNEYAHSTTAPYQYDDAPSQCSSETVTTPYQYDVSYQYYPDYTNAPYQCYPDSFEFEVPGSPFSLFGDDDIPDDTEFEHKRKAESPLEIAQRIPTFAI